MAILYGLASFLHFAHNAEYLADYPNLPEWLTRSQIYTVWLCIVAVGVAGYGLYQRGWPMIGLAVLTAYAMVGLDGLLHYTRAPIEAHTAAMNATIWFEVTAAASLLILIIHHVIRRVSERIEGFRL